MRTYFFELGSGGGARKYERVQISEINADCLEDAIYIASRAAPLPVRGQRISIALLFDDRRAVVWFKCLDPWTHHERACA